MSSAPATSNNKKIIVKPEKAKPSKPKIVATIEAVPVVDDTDLSITEEPQNSDNGTTNSSHSSQGD